MPEPPASENIPFSLGFLIAEIEELVRVAEQNQQPMLAYLLDLALLEARRQARQHREDGSDVPDAERWKPV